MTDREALLSRIRNPALRVAVEGNPDRWHAATIAAASEAPGMVERGGSVADWEYILDVVEAALADVLWPQAG